MEDLRLLLKKAVEKQLSEEHRQQANSIVDVVCNALDAGGDADAISNNEGYTHYDETYNCADLLGVLHTGTKWW